MKKKLIDGSDIDKDWLLKYSSKLEVIKSGNLGFISLINIDEVSFPISVDYNSSNTILVDNGYKCIIYMPLNSNWCVSVFMNNENDIVEWYFDMTKENSIENGQPYFMDLYLDIAVSPNREVVILDRDELDEAYEDDVISESDVIMATQTCDFLIENVIPNDSFMKDFFYEYMKRLA